MEKQKFAKLYFPELTRKQARRKLGDWIRQCEPLHRQLQLTPRYKTQNQSWTPQQMQLIKDYLGEP